MPPVFFRWAFIIQQTALPCKGKAKNCPAKGMRQCPGAPARGSLHFFGTGPYAKRPAPFPAGWPRALLHSLRARRRGLTPVRACFNRPGLAKHGAIWYDAGRVSNRKVWKDAQYPVMCKAGQLAPGAGPWPCAAGVFCLLRFAPNGVLAAFVHRAWAMGLPLWARAGASFFFALCAGGRAGCLPQKAAKGTHGAPRLFCFRMPGRRSGALSGRAPARQRGRARSGPGPRLVKRRHAIWLWF